ncbi:hypothetical protein ACFL30_03980 [Candidatus Latescibacterota bacterium]
MTKNTNWHHRYTSSQAGWVIVIGYGFFPLTAWLLGITYFSLL